MPNVTYSTVYECLGCHKIYTNREEAVRCEESHKCPCEKQSFYRFGYDVHCGEAFISGIYFKEKKIVLIRDDDGTTYKRDSTDVKYCPLCGREL